MQQSVLQEQGQQEDTVNPSEFLKRQPALELPKKAYSLEPDIAMGWLPKMKIIGPIPLNFDNPLTDSVVTGLISQSSSSKVVYLGSRPHNTFRMHQELSGFYTYKYEHLYKNNYLHLQPFFRKFYHEYQPHTQYPFKGMNPSLSKEQTQVIFSSNFQGGNLDAAIRIAKGQYDVFLRIDSNTQGHNQWYYFKVKNNGQLNKIKLNIVNFRRRRTLYQRGMKPFIKVGNGCWKQGGENLIFKQTSLRYDFLKDEFSGSDLRLKQLSFQHQFTSPNEQVEFAYSVPYPYSRVLKLLNQLSSINNPEPIVTIKPLCQSLSGLQIPLATITDATVENKSKKCIFIIGRQHPGESNSSFVLQGFLRWVCSDTSEAVRLRQIAAIKVVPMVNPDGVVLGNFRTSICGKDLNRLFKKKSCLMFPQVEELRAEVVRCKGQFKDKFLLFLDFHGHSVRKNVFTYGPGFGLGENCYYKSRIFPKIISNQTTMFRYYSCSFRISEQKQSTARAFLCRHVPYCYTVESSNYSYYCSQMKTNIDFTEVDWISVGKQIALSTLYFVELIIEEQIDMKLRLQKLREKKEGKVRKQNGNESDSESTRGKTPKQMATSKSVGNKKAIKEHFQPIQGNHSSVLTPVPHYPPLPQKFPIKKFTHSQMVQQVKKVQEQIKQSQNQNQSDGFDSSGSDSESDGEDLSQNDLKKFHKEASKVLMDFEQAFFRRNTSELVIPKSLSTAAKKRKSTKEKRKSMIDIQDIQVMACLKSKVMPIEIPPKGNKLEKFKSFHILEPIEHVPSKRQLNLKKKIEKVPLPIKEYQPLVLKVGKSRDVSNDRLEKMEKFQIMNRYQCTQRGQEDLNSRFLSHGSIITKEHGKSLSEVKSKERQLNGMTRRMVLSRVLPKKEDQQIEAVRHILQDYLTHGCIGPVARRDVNSSRVKVRSISRAKEKQV